MTSRIPCPRCGKDVEHGDNFCTSCGAAVVLRCPLCGQGNAADAVSCESCGASLGAGSAARRTPTADKTVPAQKYPPLKALQSWKLTLSLALVLITALVIEKSTRSDGNSPGSALAGSGHGATQEIQALQRAVESNPRDPAPVLKLANLYHDVRLFPKAIAMYEHYLEINPTNADARVDLSTSYFELSFEDTTRRKECLAAAEEEVERALTYSPNHQLALFNLGIILFHTGEVDEALASFRKCVTVDSTSEVGRKALQFVNQHGSMDSSS